MEPNEVMSIPTVKEQAKVTREELAELQGVLGELDAAFVPNRGGGTVVGNEAQRHAARKDQVKNKIRSAEERINALQAREDSLNREMHDAAAGRDLERGLALRKRQQQKGQKRAPLQLAPAPKAKKAGRKRKKAFEPGSGVNPDEEAKAQAELRKALSGRSNNVTRGGKRLSAQESIRRQILQIGREMELLPANSAAMKAKRARIKALRREEKAAKDGGL